MLEAHLTSEYFEVLTASNGADALTIAQRGDCDIVLLDVMMPGLDGFEVCRRLKRDPATHHIPVVLVTALDQPADRVRGLEAGAEDFLTKPIDEIALIARVRSLSRLKVVLDELRSRAATSATLGMPDPVTAAMPRRRQRRPHPRHRGQGASRAPDRRHARQRCISSTSRAIRKRLCSAAPRAPTTSSSYRSACRATMACGSARSSARSSAPGMCRS